MILFTILLTGCSSILRFAYIESNKGNFDAIKVSELEQARLREETKQRTLTEPVVTKPVLDPVKEFDKSKQDALDVHVLSTTEINQGILVLVDKSIPEESFLVQMDRDVLCIRIGVKHHLATLFSDEFFLGVRKGVSVPKKE
jgi:hypothetical protein